MVEHLSHSHTYTDSEASDGFHTGTEAMEIPRLLPEGWIAVVCGASKEQGEGAENLPEGFYIAPKDVYMPDLTAAADVLLGKLVGFQITFAFLMIHNRLIGIRKRL